MEDEKDINNINIYSVDTIVENAIYNGISDQVICPICNELKLDPKMTTCPKNCQFSVCGSCANDLKKCPICRAPTKWNTCLVIKQLLPTLDFKCALCGDIIHFDDVKRHYDAHKNHEIDIVKPRAVKISDNSNLGSREILKDEIVQERTGNMTRSITIRSSVPGNFKFGGCFWSNCWSKKIIFYNIIIRTCCDLCYLYRFT